MADRTETSNECPICHGDGVVMTRHPELDDILLREVWLYDYCDCEAGQEVQAQHEAKYEDGEYWGYYRPRCAGV